MTPLQEGMIVSNEPGYYEDHSFGIRIEVILSFFYLYFGHQGFTEGHAIELAAYLKIMDNLQILPSKS